MKSTGVVRKIDELGRIVIPIELRRTMGIDDKDSLEILIEGEKIVLQKYSPGCIFAAMYLRFVITKANTYVRTVLLKYGSKAVLKSSSWSGRLVSYWRPYLSLWAGSVIEAILAAKLLLLAMSSSVIR